MPKLKLKGNSDLLQLVFHILAIIPVDYGKIILTKIFADIWDTDTSQWWSLQAKIRAVKEVVNKHFRGITVFL